jgi:hypothetical protein
MLFLQNNEEFARIGVLASDEGGELSESDREVLQRVPQARIVGAYSRVGGRIVGVFRSAGALFLLVDSRAIDWQLVQSVFLEDQPADRRRLRVVIPGEEFHVEYAKPVLDPPLSSTHEPFVEDEDYEFCLFVRNLAIDPGRRARVFRSGGE